MVVAESVWSLNVICYTCCGRCCCSVNVEPTHIPFEKLDFGETDVLDKFYNADVAIVDMSVHVQQSALVYHIGVRESMGMPQTIITLHDTDPEFTLSVKVSSQGLRSLVSNASVFYVIICFSRTGTPYVMLSLCCSHTHLSLL